MAAFELESVAKESTTAVKQEYKFGKEVIKEYGQIMLFILPGSQWQGLYEKQKTRVRKGLTDNPSNKRITKNQACKLTAVELFSSVTLLVSI